METKEELQARLSTLKGQIEDKEQELRQLQSGKNELNTLLFYPGLILKTPLGTIEFRPLEDPGDLFDCENATMSELMDWVKYKESEILTEIETCVNELESLYRQKSDVLSRLHFLELAKILLTS